jgi:hypothetical protein
MRWSVEMAAEALDDVVTGAGENRSGRRPPASEPAPIDDRLLRWIGVPGFGLVIPQLTGLFGPHGPGAAIFWIGNAWFVLLAWLVWHANRWLLFKTREHVDWFDHPLRKIALLLFGVLFGTIPVTVAMLAAWYEVARLPADWGVIRTVTLVNVICVVFVTHVYETVFLIKAREDDRLAAARLERARVESELEALRAQVDPHFLFNSLNTLAYLVREDPARAAGFTERLARVYRYLLASRGRPLVLLAEELELAQDYAGLLALRFGDALSIRIDAAGVAADRFLVPPVSLQLLVENAVKHNEVSLERPLAVAIAVRGDAVVVENARQPRARAEGAGVGLANLAERVRRTTGRELGLETEGARFVVTVPLLPV